MTKLKLPCFRRRPGSLEKTVIEGSRKRERPNMRWINYIKGRYLQELNQAVEDKTLWTSLIHRVTNSMACNTQTNLINIGHINQ